VTGCCEFGNELSYIMECEEFLDRPSVCQLLITCVELLPKGVLRVLAAKPEDLAINLSQYHSACCKGRHRLFRDGKLREAYVL
jgi:hypothetical protein